MMRKIKLKSRQQREIESLQAENTDVKMALIEQDISSGEEINLLKQTILQLDVEVQSLKGGV